MTGSWSDRLAALSPAKRALLEKRLGRSPGDAGPRISAAPRDGLIPASFSQERMWLIHQLDPEVIAYNSQVAIHFKGPLDVPSLQRALDEIVRRHEIYRTSLVEVDGALTQDIHPPHAADVRNVDLSELPAPEREPAARRILEEGISRPFRLGELPLVRWTLIRLDAERHTLVCMDHHAVTDGWSRNVVFKELMALYAALVAGASTAVLPQPRLQFADFSTWQRNWMGGAEARAQIDYWKGRLMGCPGLLDLPYDRPHPTRQSFRGGHELMHLSEEELRSLREVAAGCQATMFMSLLSVFLVLLHRTCVTDDLCVGTGIANRRLADTDELIGMLINTVVLRPDLSGNPTFRELLGRVQSMTLEAYANQEAPFEKVVEAVAPIRHPGVNALHQVTFNLQNNPMPDIRFPGLEATLERPLFNGSSKFDLYVAGWPRSEDRRGSWHRDDEAVLLSWEYNTDVFEVSTIRTLQAHFRNLLADAGGNPDRPLSELTMDDETERRVVTEEWNATPAPERPDTSIATLFQEQAAKRPSAVAVVCNDRKLKYRELDERSSALAASLVRAGVGPDSIVGIFMERSPDMISGLLGILKAGGCYVPLDPAERRGVLLSQLAECRPGVVLASRELASRFPSQDARIVIAEDAALSPDGLNASGRDVTTDQLAYVLFTSGSTGEPRPVAVPHRGVIRLIRGSDFARMDAGQVWLQISPLAFDASTLEIWAPLCNGGRLVLMPPGLPTLEDVGATIRENGVTSAWMTAGLFQLMANERLDDLSGLEQLITGGDVVPVESARKVMERFPDLRLVNGYGPTENTTFTCCHTITPDDLRRRSLPIGRPIAGTTVYILDGAGRPCAVGVPGELCTGGAGLARGYWNHPEATAAKFFVHPRFGRLYRTGDLCRHLQGGVVEFLGRIDRQVKVRGFRIEPGEVETALRKSSAVRDCAVAVRGETSADKFLVAFVVPVSLGSPPPAEDLRLFLRQYLPDHALPSRIHFLDQIPLTRNGKIDRDYLASVSLNATPGSGEPVLPRTPMEEIVSDIWEEVLLHGAIGVHEDFFQAGGHSLAALKILSLMRARTGIALKTLDFFEQPTVAGIAARAEERIADPRSPYASGRFLIELRAQGTGTPLFIVPGGWGEANEVLVFAALLSRLNPDRPVYAVRSRSLDTDRPIPESLSEQVEDVLEAISQVTPRGPFSILGECAASTVAMSLASRAESLGRRLRAVILLDPGPLAHLRSLSKRITASAEADGTQPVGVLPAGPAKYYGLLGSWKPRPVHCPLHILLSSRFPNAEEVRKSWKRLAKGPLYVHNAPGDHSSYIRRDASGTARLLEAALADE